MSLVLSICVGCHLIRLHRLHTLFSWCLTEALNQRAETFDGIVVLGTKIDVLRVMGGVGSIVSTLNNVDVAAGIVGN